MKGTPLAQRRGQIEGRNLGSGRSTERSGICAEGEEMGNRVDEVLRCSRHDLVVGRVFRIGQSWVELVSIEKDKSCQYYGSQKWSDTATIVVRYRNGEQERLSLDMAREGVDYLKHGWDSLPPLPAPPPTSAEAAMREVRSGDTFWELRIPSWDHWGWEWEWCPFEVVEVEQVLTSIRLRFRGGNVTGPPERKVRITSGKCLGCVRRT